MVLQKPQDVTLTPQERVLLEQIVFDLLHCDRETVIASCLAAANLSRSLLGRKAIPKIRLRYFTDPELNIGGHGKSHKQIFEGNGTRGQAVLEHPHFLPFLKYFIFGPELPMTTIGGFLQIVEERRGTSGEVLKQLCSFSRAEARRLPQNDRRKAREEFFKLALETGLGLGFAESIRDAVRSVR